MNTKYHDGVDLLGVKEMITTPGWDKLTAAGVGEIGVESDSISQDDIKPVF